MWKWYLLAVPLGGLAVFVWGLDQRPLWRSGPNAGKLEGFSPDGKVLVTTIVPGVWDNGWPPPIVTRFDAETGKVLSRVMFPCKYPGRLKSIRPSADGRIALVGEGFSVDPSRLDFWRGDWFLHNGETAERVAGPISGLAFALAFSPDARWFYGRSGDPQGGQEGFGGIEIYSSATGERLIELGERDGLQAGGCAFAPDGESVAVGWWPIQPPDGEWPLVIQVFGLPSGKELRQLTLPPKKWTGKMQYLDSRLLRVHVREPINKPEGVFRAFTFDLCKNPIGDGVEDLALRTRMPGRQGPDFCLDGGVRIAQCSFVPHDNPNTPTWWDRLMDVLGFRGKVFPGPRVWVRFVDRQTGETLHEIRRPLGITVFLSPDGQRIAGAGDNGTIEVWHTNPWPRWPSALLVGGVAAAGVLVIGQRRQKRPKFRRSLS